MMPAFPSPPRQFRTAGFPQYGFKASLSDRTFPPPDAVQCAPHIPAPRPGVCRPSLASATTRRYGSESTPGGASTSRCARGGDLSTPGGLGSGSGCVVPIRRRLRRPHPSVSRARGDFTAEPRLRRAFAVRERRGDPGDLPDVRCCAFPTCRRPYAGGAEAPTRCVRAPIPGSLVLSLSRPPQRPSLPAIPDGVMPFRRCIVRVMLRPVCLPRPPDWRRRRTGPRPPRRLLRTVSPPLFTRPVATPRWGAS